MRSPCHTAYKTWWSVALVCFCCLAGCDWLSSGRTLPGGATAERTVYALGKLEPATGVVSISAIPGERLKALDPDVAENERVPANGILGLLTSYDLGKAQLEALVKKQEIVEKSRLHQVEVAKAQKAQSEAALAQALAKLKELVLQEGKLETLKAASELAEEEFAQLTELSESDPDLVTPHELRKRENEMQQALQEYKIASESYASAREAAEKAVTAARANIRVAELTLAQLDEQYEKQSVEQEIEVAKETLERSVLVAPNVSEQSLDNVLDIELVQEHGSDDDQQRGPYTVLKTFLRPGEFITQTPIIQLADLREMVCIAEVYEADVNEICVGQQVTIRSPAFSGNYADRFDAETDEKLGGIQGEVVRIGALVGSPGLANRNPLAPADRNVMEVRIAIPDPQASRHASSRVGLQVTVEFGEKPEDCQSDEPVEASDQQTAERKEPTAA